MARITIDDCIDKVENQFDLTHLASKRAFQIAAGSVTKVNIGNDKPVVIALREVAASETTRETVEKEEKENLEASRSINGIAAHQNI